MPLTPLALSSLIFALSAGFSHAQSPQYQVIQPEDDRQSVKLLQQLATYTFSKTSSPAFGLYRNKAVLYNLTLEQRRVIYHQLACDANEQEHGNFRQEQRQQNRTAEVRERDRATVRYKIDCEADSAKMSEFARCACDNSTIPDYCRLLAARDETAAFRRETRPCAAELWSRLPDKLVANFRRMDRDTVAMFAFIASTFSDEATDVEQFIAEYRATMNNTEELCDATAEMHRIMRELRRVDIRFRLHDDLIYKRTMAALPLHFCSEEARLARCLCEEARDTSAVFCLADFVRHAMIVYTDGEACKTASPVASLLPVVLLLIAMVLLRD